MATAAHFVSSDTTLRRRRATLDGGQHPELEGAAIEVRETESHAEGATVADADAVETTHACPACHVPASIGDTFCTACGTRLPAIDAASRAGQSGEDTVVAGPGTSPSTPEMDNNLGAAPVATTANDPPSSLRSRRVLAAIATVAVLGIAASAALAILWRSEAGHATRLGTRLDATTAQLHATKAMLASTQARLAATSSLSARRRLVLLRAQTVLAKVDPLLSDADGLKQITVQIQTARDAFAADSSQMTSDLITLENFEANPQNTQASTSTHS